MDLMLAETVIYLDGDAANEAFALLYCDGWPDGTAETLAHLAQWDYGEPSEPYALQHISPYSSFETSQYVMHWGYPYGWIALERKLNPAEE